MSGSVWEELRKPVDDLTSRASQNVKHLGEDWNIPYLEQEGRKNEKNPGRAYGKAAAAIASYYLGGALGAGGGAGANAAGTVAEEGAKTAAEELAKQEMLNAAQYAGQQGMLSGGVMSVAPGAGILAPGMQNVAQADTALINAGYPNMAGGRLTGMLKTGANSPAGKYAIQQGIKGLAPQQPQPAQVPPPRAPQQQQPMPQMYGAGLNDPTLGMDEETKRRYLMMMYGGGFQ